MRPAEFSTENPPCEIDNVELAEYIKGLRRRIEVQNDQMAALAAQVLKHINEIEKLSIDLAIKNATVPPAWQEVK